MQTDEKRVGAGDKKEVVEGEAEKAWIVDATYVLRLEVTAAGSFVVPST